MNEYWSREMAERAITRDEAAELYALRAEYLRATRLAANAMRKAEKPLSGEALQAVLEGEKRAESAIFRMKEIQGPQGQGVHGAPIHPQHADRQ
jgi:hypothetical protein